MVDMRGKIVLCDEVFTEEEVWDAVLEVSEFAHICAYSDVSDFYEGMTTEEEKLVYEYLKKNN